MASLRHIDDAMIGCNDNANIFGYFGGKHLHRSFNDVKNVAPLRTVHTRPVSLFIELRNIEVNQTAGLFTS